MYLIENMSLWFVLQQGALLQCYILLFSFVTMKWKHPTVHAAKILFITAEVLFCLMTALLNCNRIETSSVLFAGGWSLLTVGGTFAMFVITLISAKLLRKLRKTNSV